MIGTLTSLPQWQAAPRQVRVRVVPAGNTKNDVLRTLLAALRNNYLRLVSPQHLGKSIQSSDGLLSFSMHLLP